MQEIILQFVSAQDLWKFKMKIEASEVEINLSNITLASRFKKEEIELAIKEFKAHMVINLKEEQRANLTVLSKISPNSYKNA